MALNLSTLTSPATSGDVLAEALTTADFLEPVPVLRNLARGSQKGGDAKQGTALNQPKALPLIKNPSGNLGGYLYIPNVSGNYASAPSVTIGSNETWEAEVDMVITQYGNYILPMGGGLWPSGFGAFLNAGQNLRVFSKGDAGTGVASQNLITLGTPFNIKYGFDGTNIYADIDDTRVFEEATTSNQANSIAYSISLNHNAQIGNQGNYAIQKAKLTVNSSVVFDCDFNGSTSIRHGDTKFQAAVGGPVTINQAGNDPATIIKKPVLRFDGTNDTLGGLFNQTLDGGYMFAAFSVLGDGGVDYGRIISTNKTGSNDTDASGFIWALRNNLNNDLHYYFQGFRGPHHDFFDSDRGDYIYELKNTSGSQKSKVNGADVQNSSISTSLELQEFNIGAQHQGLGRYTSIDLEYLALFPATITDAQADSVRNYINNRNTVFDLKDGFGYYFYDAQKAPVGAISSGSSAWNGRIVGSDNGDTDKLATQATANDQCVGDGFKVTFADNSDHLDIPSTTQAGWQVVGTSLGTFAYRVDSDAVTEINLLGNFGNASFRKAGDLYGIVLLPESATSADIEQARSLLIDRGAADGTTGNNFNTFWYDRTDIVEFSFLNTSTVTSFAYSWVNCSSLQSFPLLDCSNVTSMLQAWLNNSSLQSFPAIQAPLCTNFTSAWQATTALQSFPAGAKLGTAASNVDFTSAFQSSGLTSFPALDLSNGTLFSATFKLSAITSFPEGILLGTNSNAVRFDQCWMDCSGLTSFPNIDLSEGRYYYAAWFNNTNLVDFPSLFTNWNPSIITSGVFNLAWDGCSSLTADSVENILTSIDASGQYATSTGASGGSALADAGIDIDYNTATGSLSAATNAAVTSLKAKGWSIIVNNVTL